MDFLEMNKYLSVPLHVKPKKRKPSYAQAKVKNPSNVGSQSFEFSSSSNEQAELTPKANDLGSDPTYFTLAQISVQIK